MRTYFLVFVLIYPCASDRLYLRGVTENGKRFAFRQGEYILRASSIFGGGTNGKYSERQKIGCWKR